MFNTTNKISKIISFFTNALILETDKQGNVKQTIVNTQTDIKTKNIKNIYQIFNQKEHKRLEQLINYPSTQTQYLELEKRYNGEKYVGIQIVAVDHTRYVLLTHPNISDEKIYQTREYEELKDLSQTDPLTQVLNRYGLIKKAEKLITNSDPYKRIGIAFIDIDDLKSINDTYGHDMGDKTITTVTNTIKSITRSRDFTARIGGDEFVIITEEVSGHRSSVYGLAKKLLKNISKTEEQSSTTISIGVHVFRAKKLKPCIKETGSFEKCFFEQIKEADSAAYEAKKSGKNKICVSTNYKRYYKTESKASV